MCCAETRCCEYQGREKNLASSLGTKRIDKSSLSQKQGGKYLKQEVRKADRMGQGVHGGEE